MRIVLISKPDFHPESRWLSLDLIIGLKIGHLGSH
jgi:hypothetical protein